MYVIVTHNSIFCFSFNIDVFFKKYKVYKDYEALVGSYSIDTLFSNKNCNVKCLKINY